MNIDNGWQYLFYIDREIILGYIACIPQLISFELLLLYFTFVRDYYVFVLIIIVFAVIQFPHIYLSLSHVCAYTYRYIIYWWNNQVVLRINIVCAFTIWANAIHIIVERCFTKVTVYMVNNLWRKYQYVNWMFVLYEQVSTQNMRFYEACVDKVK
jgi:hypothetical protein